jgi:hypothetical protein
MEIEWTDEDPATGAKRFVRAEKFARRWQFKVRLRRRTNWEPAPQVTRAMWETLLDALERRYPRREGVSDDDLAHVRRVIAELKPPPEFDGEEEGISPQRHEGHTKTHKEGRSQGSEDRGQGAEDGSG